MFKRFLISPLTIVVFYLGLIPIGIGKILSLFLPLNVIIHHDATTIYWVDYLVTGWMVYLILLIIWAAIYFIIDSIKWIITGKQ